MKKIILPLILSWMTATIIAQPSGTPVHVTTDWNETGDGHGVITFSADITPGWHIYSVEEMQGPTSASLTIENIKGARLMGKLKPTAQPLHKYEEMFGSEVYYFENSVTFEQHVLLTGGAYKIQGYLTYGACNSVSCTPPTDEDFNITGDFTAQSKTEDTSASSEEDKSASPQETDNADSIAYEADTANATTETLAGKIDGSSTGMSQDDSSTHTLLWLFIMGFAGGIMALFTPCVWPIIPLTVGFFLKRGAGGYKGTSAALLYGAAIVIIYVTLGLTVTAVFGASALNDLSTNAFFNLLFFAMLTVFGISFVCDRELTLPASWAGVVENKANSTTGFLSIFLMAFTLVLVSFSCTGPIIGFLLVEVVSTSIKGPAVGMLGFSLALALPFTLFAMFPKWLKSAPKSGSWMQVIKIVLGYVELAFALKFLSVADMTHSWGILPRWLFITLWIALAIAMSLQLMLRQKGALILRITISTASVCFAMYLLPGLWGAPVKAVSAFAPPMPDKGLVISDFEEGLTLAKKKGKRVFVDFTGYGCVNCRKMEATVFRDERIMQTLENDYIVIRLYVDDKTPLEEPIHTEYGGKQRTLRTVGDRWSHLQATRFGAQTQPFYIILDEDGNAIASARSYDEDADAFLKWLQ